MVIATPFDEDPRYFYYNHKINCMPASGTVTFSDRTIAFEPETAFGLLDWGRGVWPFNHEWVWGSGSAWIGGKRFGFNIGFGFGNTEAATENMLFYDGNAHKLNEVYVDLAAGGYMSPKKSPAMTGGSKWILSRSTTYIPKRKCCSSTTAATKFSGVSKAKPFWTTAP